MPWGDTVHMHADPQLTEIIASGEGFSFTPRDNASKIAFMRPDIVQRGDSMISSIPLHVVLNVVYVVLMLFCLGALIHCGAFWQRQEPQTAQAKYFVSE